MSEKATNKYIDLGIVLDDHDDSPESKAKHYWIDPLYKNGHANVVYDVRSDSCIHVIEYSALAEKDAEIVRLKLALEKVREQRNYHLSQNTEDDEQFKRLVDHEDKAITSILTGESK